MRVSMFAATLIFGFVIGLLVPSKHPLKPQKPPRLLETLGENTGTHFPLKQVIRETTGHQVLPLDLKKSGHQKLQEAISIAAAEVAREMSQENSPARAKSRINEVSSLFEEAMRDRLDSQPDLSCDYPKTKSGESQRSGYPDLRLEHLPTGTVAYLDPKLFKDSSLDSSFRTFYFEPGGENSKVTEDALHLLIGFPHDGATGKWTFGQAKFIDLSSLEVTLKTEFSASNKEVYREGTNE